MRCQFCTQWNPNAAADCAFCGNDLRGALDATCEGRPAYESAPAGRNAAVERQAAKLVHSSNSDSTSLASDNYVRAILDMMGTKQRSVVLMIVTLALAYLLYRITEC
jgi:hypothetical protein